MTGGAKKRELVRDEICAYCGKVIGPKMVACLWKEKIACYKCNHHFETEARYEEERRRYENAPASQDVIIQLRNLGASVVPGLTNAAANKLLDEAYMVDRVKHYLNGLWKKTHRRPIRDYGIEQEEVLSLARTVIRENSVLAAEVNQLLQLYPRSEVFLQYSSHELRRKMTDYLNVFSYRELLVSLDDADDDDDLQYR